MLYDKNNPFNIVLTAIIAGLLLILVIYPLLVFSASLNNGHFTPNPFDPGSSIGTPNYLQVMGQATEEEKANDPIMLHVTGLINSIQQSPAIRSSPDLPPQVVDVWQYKDKVFVTLVVNQPNNYVAVLHLVYEFSGGAWMYTELHCDFCLQEFK